MDEQYTVIERRENGSFVIEKNDSELGLIPYHVTPDYCPELWAAVCVQEGLDPEAQAAKYREATNPEALACSPS